MSKVYFPEKTLDDIMRTTITEIFENGIPIKATKGDNSELNGILLEIENPRARLSRTESRAKPFSCLGELCWYLSGSNDVDFIQYYIKEYNKYGKWGRVNGAYGPRLFCYSGLNQVGNVLNLLKRKKTSRQAVIQILNPVDLINSPDDMPCTCSLQFLIRDEKLCLITYMRSNDIYWGLPHDIFCFTMLQEIIARTLNIEIGNYKHAVGSLHLYDKHKEEAQNYINEGWQQSIPMPVMPIGDPWPSIKTFLEAEHSIRMTGGYNSDEVTKLDPYWSDLVNLLQIFEYYKKNNAEGIESEIKKIKHDAYKVYTSTKLEQVKRNHNDSPPKSE